MYLMDTNVISESRKVHLGKANTGLTLWTESTAQNSMYVSVITLMEIEQGILGLSRRDKKQGNMLNEWFQQTVRPAFSGRILDVDESIALLCASLHVPDKKPANDALIAATAMVHGLTLVTRNTADFENLNISLFNPFS